jgi:hypothetical protein
VGGAHWPPWLFVACHGEILVVGCVSCGFFVGDFLVPHIVGHLCGVLIECGWVPGWLTPGLGIGRGLRALLSVFLFMIRIGDSAFLLAVDCCCDLPTSVRGMPGHLHVCVTTHPAV